MGVLTWNLFHGRDLPPDPALFTRRSRLLGTTERNATHAQVNRPLLGEFAGLLAGEDWQVALLQEAPPRWLRPLGRRCGAGGASALTSRNLGAAGRAWVAERNPDLIASNEGGSNQILVRPPWRLARVRRLTLTHRPERRSLLWACLESEDGRTLAVANMHLSTVRELAEREVLTAAEQAVAWSAGAPLVFGGDLNLRPRDSPATFAALEQRFALAAPTGPRAIDHLLVRGLEVEAPPRALPAARREVRGGDGLAIRLSDHAPVTASVRLASDGPDARKALLPDGL